MRAKRGFGGRQRFCPYLKLLFITILFSFNNKLDSLGRGREREVEGEFVEGLSPKEASAVARAKEDEGI